MFLYKILKNFLHVGMFLRGENPPFFQVSWEVIWTSPDGVIMFSNSHVLLGVVSPFFSVPFHLPPSSPSRLSPNAQLTCPSLLCPCNTTLCFACEVCLPAAFFLFLLLCGRGGVQLSRSALIFMAQLRCAVKTVLQVPTCSRSQRQGCRQICASPRSQRERF